MWIKEAVNTVSCSPRCNFTHINLRFTVGPFTVSPDCLHPGPWIRLTPAYYKILIISVSQRGEANTGFHTKTFILFLSLRILIVLFSHVVNESNLVLVQTFPPLVPRSHCGKAASLALFLSSICISLGMLLQPHCLGVVGEVTAFKNVPGYGCR